MTSLHYGTSWTYGNCSFEVRDDEESKGITNFVEKCCVYDDEYTLTCRDSEKKGWQGGYIEIQGHKYCHDFFVGYVTRERVTVLGRHLYFRFCNKKLRYYFNISLHI